MKLSNEFEQFTDSVREIESENEDMKKKIIDLEEGAFVDLIRINELESLPDAAPFEAVLERFADHRNWVDGRYAPIIHELDDHPADVANRVLQENA